jgi:hypothetical protein
LERRRVYSEAGLDVYSNLIIWIDFMLQRVIGDIKPNARVEQLMYTDLGVKESLTLG